VARTGRRGRDHRLVTATLAVDRPVDHPPDLLEPAEPGLLGWVVGAGLVVTAAAGALVLLVPGTGVLLGLGLLFGAVPLGAAALVLLRRPELAPWGALLIFVTSAELRLRVHPAIGLLKDVYVVVLVGLVVLYVLRRPSTVRRLRTFAFPLAALGVLVALYLLDPAGSHDTSWVFGTRLLLEVLALLLVGLLLAPREALGHLVRAMTVIVPAEAAFAWLQQAAGADRLVYQWGYEYGAQVRSTSGGGLRVSGTFEDPFQLAALAVLAMAVGIFAATSRRQAVVLIVAGLAVLAATSVRTAMVQVALLLVVYAVRRGWGRQAAALGMVAAVTGVLVLATTTASVTPGAPEEPLLFTLNGRSTSWALAIDGVESLVMGNGVGARGTGSTRTDTGLTAPPSYDGTAPNAYFAGNPAFLDSSYAQVQSDVGIVGSAALVLALGGLAAVVVRRCRDPRNGAAWAACGVLAVTLVDWVGRSSLASYTTGFLTLYVLGVLLGASHLREDAR
jgi:hypothetical protein